MAQSDHVPYHCAGRPGACYAKGLITWREAEATSLSVLHQSVATKLSNRVLVPQVNFHAARTRAPLFETYDRTALRHGLIALHWALDVLEPKRVHRLLGKKSGLGVEPRL